MLTRLEAESFRNLAPLSWSPGPGRHLLSGGNGAGKTSLLEAVYAVATTRSFRTPRLAECVRHGAAGFHLSAEVEDDARTGLAVAYSVEGPGLDRAVNGARVPLSEHLAVLPVVPWTSEDAEVVTGPPARRRRFLDRGVVSLRPGALDALGRYREALSEKRELLARPAGPRQSTGPGERGAPGGSSDASLEAWNRVLAGAAVEVARLRSAYAGAVEGQLRAVLEEAGVPFPPVTLAYRPSPAAALEGEEEVFLRLARAAPAERRRRIPLVGPHRDELEVRWGDHPAAQVASAGERKALSLALAAAHGRVLAAAGREPAYLLDDLDAELAPDTLAALWRAFDGVPQLLATSNRPAVWGALDLDHRWRVEDGHIADG